MEIIRAMRPRVLAAVYELGTFTIAELCRAADLKNRDQAYSQIHWLKERGFLVEKTLPEGAAHAPRKQFALNPEMKAAFANVMAEYRPVLPVETESEMGDLALEDAERDLNRAEEFLRAAEGGDFDEAGKQLEEANGPLNSARTNIGTAELEYEGTTNNDKTRRIGLLRQLLEKAEAKRNHLAQRPEPRRALPRVNLGGLLVDAARQFKLVFAKADSTLNQFEKINYVGNRLQENWGSGEYRAPMEVLLDEIRAHKSAPFVPIFRHALRVEDAYLLLTILNMLDPGDQPWWNYNRESARYLMTPTFHKDSWLSAYRLLQKSFPFSPNTPFKVFSCGAERLTADLYLDVTKGQGVSLVSPQEITFLGTPEFVQPTLLVEAASMLKALNCAFLNPDKSLYAYGPIANDIACWQGAPDLRIAACLGMWGLRLDEKLSQITTPLSQNRVLLIAQGQDAGLSPDAASVLLAEEIAVCRGVL